MSPLDMFSQPVSAASLISNAPPLKKVTEGKGMEGDEEPVTLLGNEQGNSSSAEHREQRA